VLELDAARETEMVQLNVVAVHELTLAFVAPMVARRAGAILNVASIAAFQPVPGMATYAATKAFVQSFSEALHAELAGTGVSCTVLSPGPVPTEFGEVAGTQPAESLVPGFVTGDAGEVATAAVRGMLRGRRTVVPGTATKGWRPAGAMCRARSSSGPPAARPVAATAAEPLPGGPSFLARRDR
jgi:short-subunit dehydrogenase